MRRKQGTYTLEPPIGTDATSLKYAWTSMDKDNKTVKIIDGNNSNMFRLQYSPYKKLYLYML